MEKIAIINTSSLLKYNDLMTKLKKIGEVDHLTLEKDLQEDEIAEALSRYNYIILGTTPNITKAILDRCVDLKQITRQGIGYDNIDIDYARKKGVLVTNIPAIVEKEDVAEHAIALMLCSAKRIVISNNAVNENEWQINRSRFYGQRLHKKTFGIIGFGNIGKSLAQKIKSAFQGEILVYDPYIDPKDLNDQYKLVKFDELIKESDIISLNLPSTKETKGIINLKALRQMKKNCILVNTARGDLVVEEDVRIAIDRGYIFSYATDVVAVEPIQEDSPLLNHNNIIITPHTAVYNAECNYDMCLESVKNILEVKEGKNPSNLVSNIKD